MFKICLVGCGNMANDGHGPALKKYAAEHPGTVLAGCCDIVPGRAEEFKNKFGFEKAYTDYRAMLNEIRPDAVTLISPVEATSALATSILEMGYPLMLEKPPGRNAQEIMRINDAALASGVTARVAFNRRYTPLIALLRSLIEHEQIRSITYQMYRYHRTEPDFSTTAIHAIEAVSFIAGGEYEKVDFCYQELPEAGEKVANIYMNARLSGGIVAQLAMVPMGGTVCERISVNTDKAAYFVEASFWNNFDSPGRLRRVENGRITHDIGGEELVEVCEMYEENGFYEENRGFFEMLRSGAPVSNDLPGAVQSVEIANCIRQRFPCYPVPQDASSN